MTSPDQLNIAVVGATGEVGQAMLAQLNISDLPIGTMRVMASERSAGKELKWRGISFEVEDATQADLADIDIALFSAGGGTSRELAPKFAEAGAVVIDNSSAWRAEKDVPLVVSEVNPKDLDHMPRRIVANPNCTTMIGMVAINPLHQVAGLRTMDVKTVQAVSGAGHKGIMELDDQVDLFGHNLHTLGHDNRVARIAHTVFPGVVAFNVLPIAGSIAEGEYESDEEKKLRDESRKILHLPELLVDPSCKRGGIVTGHLLDVTLGFEEPITAEEAMEIIDRAPGVTYSHAPTPHDVVGSNEVLAGRIRPATTKENALQMVIVGDNLLKGAAGNAVQVAGILAPRILAAR